MTNYDTRDKRYYVDYDNTRDTTWTSSTDRRLHRLNELDDWKVHEDDYDVRGWSVKDAAGNTVGKVENLIVDKSMRRVRYLEVDLSSSWNDFGSKYDNGYTNDDSHIFLPIGLVTLDGSDNDVHIKALQTDHVFNAPRYRRNTPFTPEREVATYSYLTGPAGNPGLDNRGLTYNTSDYLGAPSLDDDFYTSPYFDDSAYNTSARTRSKVIAN